MPRLPHLPTAPNTPVMNCVSSQMRLMMRLSFRRWAVVKAALYLVILAMPATVAAQTAESIEYFHTDAIGSVRMVTGPTGEVIERRDFLPFGEELVPPPNAQPLGFGGAEGDAETAGSSSLPLNYFGARHLQAAIGRFITVDPGHADGTLTDPQSWNGYAYARNRPLFFVDPDGRQNREPVYTCDCTFFLFGDGDSGDFSWAREAARAAQQVSDQAESLAGLIAAGEYVRGFLSTALDAVPVVSVVKASVELATGYDYVGGKDVSRYGAGIGLAAALIPGGKALVTVAKTARAARAARLAANRQLGNAFRDQLANAFRQAGYEVRTEVYKKTLFGKRFIDIQLSKNGQVLGGIEAKVGGARYSATQQAKDLYLKVTEGYNVNVVRQP